MRRCLRESCLCPVPSLITDGMTVQVAADGDLLKRLQIEMRLLSVLYGLYGV